jgi:Ca2+:H+ antiporter
MAHRSRRSSQSREYPNGRPSYTNGSSSREYTSEKTSRTVPPHSSSHDRRDRRQSLPQYNHNGHEVTKGIHPEGESGRRGFNPFKFLVICGRSSSLLSMLVNLLWPVVPVAIALVGLRPRWLTPPLLYTNLMFSTSQSRNGIWPSSSPTTSPCYPLPIC